MCMRKCREHAREWEWDHMRAFSPNLNLCAVFYLEYKPVHALSAQLSVHSENYAVVILWFFVFFLFFGWFFHNFCVLAEAAFCVLVCCCFFLFFSSLSLSLARTLSPSLCRFACHKNVCVLPLLWYTLSVVVCAPLAIEFRHRIVVVAIRFSHCRLNLFPLGFEPSGKGIILYAASLPTMTECQLNASWADIL